MDQKSMAISHTVEWGGFSRIGIDPEMIRLFPLPAAPVDPSVLTDIRLWRNNNGAELELEFTPAHWSLLSSSHFLVTPPSLRFLSCIITSLKDWYQKPRGYMHDAETKPFHCISEIFVQDEFTKKLDEFFVARLWSGKNNQLGPFEIPGIGASLQRIYFTAAPHIILAGTGEAIFYA